MNVQRLSKWERWLDDVAADLFELWYDETRWRQLHELAQDNPAIPNAYDFLGWVDVLYLQAAALGVRRQAEIRDDSISLARLLNEVAHDPAVLLNAPFHFSVCHGHESIAFTITPSVEDVARAAEEDLRQLRTAATSVVETVNKAVAHRESVQARRGSLDASAVERATRLLRTVLVRYTFAIKGSIFLSGPLPSYEWMQAFTVPWTTPEQICSYYDRDYHEHD